MVNDTHTRRRMPKDSIQTCVVTSDAIKHFIIPTEALFIYKV